MSAGWITGVRFTKRRKYFSLNICIQTGSEAHPASYLICTGDYFPGDKSAGD
jgi:hypothetical protein